MSFMLSSLHIHQDYVNPKKLVGTVSFVGEKGEIKINLDTERAGRILEVVAEEMVETSKGLAKMMTSQVLDQVESSVKLIDGLPF